MPAETIVDGVDVSMRPTEVAEMLVNKLARELVTARDLPTREARLAGVGRAMDALQRGIWCAVEYRNEALTRALADLEAANARIEVLAHVAEQAAAARTEHLAHVDDPARFR